MRLTPYTAAAILAFALAQAGAVPSPQADDASVTTNEVPPANEPMYYPEEEPTAIVDVNKRDTTFTGKAIPYGEHRKWKSMKSGAGPMEDADVEKRGTENGGGKHSKHGQFKWKGMSKGRGGPEPDEEDFEEEDAGVEKRDTDNADNGDNADDDNNEDGSDDEDNEGGIDLTPYLSHPDPVVASMANVVRRAPKLVQPPTSHWWQQQGGGIGFMPIQNNNPNEPSYINVKEQTNMGKAIKRSTANVNGGGHGGPAAGGHGGQQGGHEPHGHKPHGGQQGSQKTHAARAAPSGAQNWDTPFGGSPQEHGQGPNASGAAASGTWPTNMPMGSGTPHDGQGKHHDGPPAGMGGMGGGHGGGHGGQGGKGGQGQ